MIKMIKCGLFVLQKNWNVKMVDNKNKSEIINLLEQGYNFSLANNNYIDLIKKYKYIKQTKCKSCKEEDVLTDGYCENCLCSDCGDILNNKIEKGMGLCEKCIVISEKEYNLN